MGKWVLTLLGLVSVVVLASVLSPWPGVIVIRAIFDHGAVTAADKLKKFVPASVSVMTVQYDEDDGTALLDLYRPREVRPKAPVVVWVHGGGFVSGRRQDVSNYLKVLAGNGFTVVNVDYTIAPEAIYPVPLRQVINALAFLERESGGLGIDPTRIVLAGDSAGAQIAAQTATAITNPEYAQLVGVRPRTEPQHLAGALLFCGVYDISHMGQGGGVLGWFVQTTGWAYSGTRNWRDAEYFATLNFLPFLTPAFPSAFVSAGNADPLGPQSEALSKALAEQGTPVEAVFFATDHQPPLGHEYQFDLDGLAGEMVLRRAVQWLNHL